VKEANGFSRWQSHQEKNGSDLHQRLEPPLMAFKRSQSTRRDRLGNVTRFVGKQERPIGHIRRF
jgi:hypothetical protein